MRKMKTLGVLCFWWMSLLWVVPFLVDAEEPCGFSKGGAFPAEFWVRAEYLGWAFAKSPVPLPLVTSGSFADAIPGAIGQPSTKALLGNQTGGV